jgi:NAD(P)-dependent dehydrogenase (short-subunit alcohol dehydrogenase family)
MAGPRDSLKGRIAVVTGASRGIGYHAALACAKAGAHVIAVARTVGGLEELDDEIRASGGAATLVPMDLADFAAIDRLGAEIDRRFGRLDILIGNAGILGSLSPLGHVDPKGFEKTFAVNVTANWRLIRSFDPLLKASDAGRAIFLTSGAAHSCRPFWGPYAASKAALEALARVYAAECANSAVRVVIVNPGVARTAMRAQAMPGEDPATLPQASAIAPDLVMLASPAMTENGAVWDCTHKRFHRFHPPA